ncbi:MAG: AsmA family protein [Verrucomicrobia bacterium]|nr:AsmA family protein [Verrucomicrobiota bacterium]
MKKALVRIVVVLVILVAVALVVAVLSLDSIVKKGVETLGPEMTKSDVRLDAVHISALSGRGALKGLFVGNPAGFKTPSAIKVGRVSVSLKPKSVLGDKIVVRSIQVANPEITFEGSLRGNNLSRILENVQAYAGTEKQAAQQGPKAAGRKLEVDELTITGGKINLSMTLLGGKSATVPLPDIHLENLGTGPEGITPGDLAQQVVQTVLARTTDAVAKGLTGLGKNLTGTVENAGKGAAGTVGNVLKGVGDLFKK